MWRNKKQRKTSAKARLILAESLWQWQPHEAQKQLYCADSQVRIAACGRRWGKTVSLSVDIVTLALSEALAGRACRQLVVAPTEAQVLIIAAECEGLLQRALKARPGFTLETRKRPFWEMTVKSLAAGGKDSHSEDSHSEDPHPEDPHPGADADPLPKMGEGEEKRGEGEEKRTKGEEKSDSPLPSEERASAGEGLGGNREGRPAGAAGVSINAPETHLKAVSGVSGSILVFRTAGRDGRGLRGLWAHRIVVDEAAYVPDSVISEVLLPMLTDVGGDLLLCGSPAGKRNIFYRLYARGQVQVKGRQTGISYLSFQCKSLQNPYLDKAWLKSVREDLGDSRYAQEYDAEFVEDFGAVFRADEIEQCLEENPLVTDVGGDLVSEPQEGHFYSFGIDWGRKLDYTVVAILDGTETPARLVGLHRMQQTGWQAQTQRVGELVAAFRPRRVLCDGNSIGDAAVELLQNEVFARIGDGGSIPQIERFLFGGESKLRLVDSLAIALSSRSVTYPAQRVLLSELRGFEYGRDTTSGRPRMAAAGSGHDDMVMALALAWFCAQRGAPASPRDLIMLGSAIGLLRSVVP